MNINIPMTPKTEERLKLLAYRDDIAVESLVENLILDYIQYESYKTFAVILKYYKDFDYMMGLSDEEFIEHYLKIVNSEDYNGEEEE